MLEQVYLSDKGFQIFRLKYIPYRGLLHISAETYKNVEWKYPATIMWWAELSQKLTKFVHFQSQARSP